MERFTSEFGRCQFRWNAWKGSVGDFVREVRGQPAEGKVAEPEAELSSLKGGQKFTWSLPAVVMIVQGFDAGGGQRPLTMGEILLVVSVKVQKRVRLLASDNIAVTLPLSTNLKFHECGQTDSKPRSLRGLVGKNSPDKELALRLAEELDPCSKSLSGPLTFLECYVEYFLVCIPIRSEIGKDLSEDSPLVIPGYYPITLATARCLIDVRGYDRMEDLFGLFLSTFKGNLQNSMSIADELTISSLPSKLYEEIVNSRRSSRTAGPHPFDEKEETNSTSVDPAPKGRYPSLPERSNANDLTYLSPTTSSSPSLCGNGCPRSNDDDDGAQAAIFSRNRNNRRNVNMKRPFPVPGTPGVKSGRQGPERVFLFGDDQFASMPKNAFASTPKVSALKKHSFDCSSSQARDRALTPAKSLVDLSSLGRYEDYRAENGRLQAGDEHPPKPVSNSRSFGQEVQTRGGSRVHGKAARSAALSQLFGFFRKGKGHARDGNRKNKALFYDSPAECKEMRVYPSRQDHSLIASSATSRLESHSDRGLFIEMPLPSTDSDFHSSNDYDTIDSPLLAAAAPGLKIEIETTGNSDDVLSRRKTFSKSLDDLNEFGARQESNSAPRRQSKVASVLHPLLPPEPPPRPPPVPSSFSSSSSAAGSSGGNVRHAREEPANEAHVPDLYEEVIMRGRKGNADALESSGAKLPEDYVTMGATYVLADGESLRGSTLAPNPKHNPYPTACLATLPATSSTPTGALPDIAHNVSTAAVDVRAPPASSSSSSSSSSTETKWTTMEQVPADVSELLVSDVCACLELLNLGRHAARFEEEQIDGRLLCSLSEDILVADLGLSRFETVKLLKFAREGWRPR